MTERRPTEQPDEPDFSDLGMERALLSLGERLMPQLEDPEARACLDRAREFQATLDDPDTDIPESQIASELHGLNREWPYHRQPVAVTGWLATDELGLVGRSSQALDAIFGTDRLEDSSLIEPRYLVSGLACESHGFTADFEDALGSSKVGCRAVMSLRFLRHLDTADSAHNRRARVLPSAQVLLKADVNDTAMEFGRDTLAVSQIKAERYFPITANWLADLASDKSLSPTKKLMELRDHPIADTVPHYLTNRELASLTKYAESVVNIGDFDVPYVVDLVEGAVLFNPNNKAVGALMGERNGLAQVLGLVVRVKQTGLGYNRITETKGELEYRLMMKLLGGSSAGEQGLVEIRLCDIDNIQSVREVAPGNILCGRDGNLAGVAKVKQVPQA